MPILSCNQMGRPGRLPLRMLLVYTFAIKKEWFPAVGAYDNGLTPELTFGFLSSAASTFSRVMGMLSIHTPAAL